MNTIFIIGQHRTGSTLLKNILNVHSQVIMAFDEMNLYEPFRKNTLDKFLKKSNLTTNELINLLKKRNIYGTFWRDFENSGITFVELEKELNKENKLDEQIVLTAVLQLLKEKSNVKMAGVKYPVHIRKISNLLKYFPDAKIIFLTRNPKAIIASKINDPATKKRKEQSKIKAWFIHYFTLLYFCFEYNLSIKIFFRNKENLYLVTYEDLVLHKEKTVQQICEFLGIGFEKEMLLVSGKQSSFNNTNNKTFHQDSIEKYKKVLSSFDSRLIDFLTRKSFRNIQNEPHPHL